MFGESEALAPMVSARRARLSTRRRDPWPNPQGSLGNSLCSIGSKRCWEAVGPALEVSCSILGEIKSFLESRHEHLNEGESVPCALLFEIYMIGRNEKHARPTIMFSSDSKALRQRAMKLVGESTILDKHPGITLGECSRPPILSRSPVPLMNRLPGWLIYGMDDDTNGLVNTERATWPEKLVYCKIPLNGVYGIPVLIKDVGDDMLSATRKATIGGIVYLQDRLFGFTVAHTFVDALEQTPTFRRDEMEFSFEYTSSDEDEEDDGDNEDEDLVVATSRGSVSPKCPDIDDSTWESDKSIVIQSQSQDDLDVGVRTPLSSHLRQESVVETTEAVLGRLSTVSHTDNTSNLDWALVELRIPEISPHILAHVSGGLEVSTCMVGIAPTEAAVLVITGSNGIMRGTMSRSLTFMQLPNTVAFQEMWTVRLDGIVSRGDCGSWVINPASGELYGHIVAGDPGGSIAYIIPAYQVFRDIERRLGSQVTINSQEIRNALRKSEIESAPGSGNQSSLIIESESQPDSPLYSNETNLPTSSSLIISLSAYSHVFQPNTGEPTAYTHSDSSFFSPSTSTYPDFWYHTSDTRPILGYHNSHNSRPILDSNSPILVVAPPSRSLNQQHINNPATAREPYTAASSQLRRISEFLPLSAPAYANTGGTQISPSSSSGFESPTSMENVTAGPPLQETEQLQQLQTSDGQSVRPEILGIVDNGFFLADDCWTCYRRNYFQLSCSFALHPLVPASSLRVTHNATSYVVRGFSMSIAAVVSGCDDRAIDLIQHTLERDKGPQVKPERVTLTAQPHQSVQPYGPGGSEYGTGSRYMYDHTHSQNTYQPATEHTYERIQFKRATANNGRQRAAQQQYYHLIVELSVDIGAQMRDSRWVKVAHRVSAPVVVRGRSPGYYHSEHRHSLDKVASPLLRMESVVNPSNSASMADTSNVSTASTSSASDWADHVHELPKTPNPSADTGISTTTSNLELDDIKSPPTSFDIFTLHPATALKLLCAGIEALVRITGDIPPTPPLSNPPLINMRGIQEEKEQIMRSHSYNDLNLHQRPRTPSNSNGRSAAEIHGVTLRKTPLGSPEIVLAEPYIVIGPNAEPVNLLHSVITRKFYSKEPPPISVEDYLMRIHRFCPMSTAVYLATSVYIHRVAVEERAIPITRRNSHRLLLAGLRVAMKALEDQSYAHRRFAKVGGVSESELARLEIGFCLLTNFDLVTTKEILLKHALSLNHIKSAQEAEGGYGIGLKPAPKHKSDGIVSVVN